MSGGEFAEEVKEYFLAKDPNKSKLRFGVSKANHEKAKHLETATMRIEEYLINLSN